MLTGLSLDCPGGSLPTASSVGPWIFEEIRLALDPPVSLTVGDLRRLRAFCEGAEIPPPRSVGSYAGIPIEDASLEPGEVVLQTRDSERRFRLPEVSGMTWIGSWSLPEGWWAGDPEKRPMVVDCRLFLSSTCDPRPKVVHAFPQPR